MVSPAFEKFPEVYTGGKPPALCGVRGTPLYTYGWVVSRVELYEAINGKPAVREIYLSQIYIGVERLLCTWWREKGYDDDDDNCTIPCVREFGPKYVVIFLACNDSEAIIKSVMENINFHEECRACLGYPKMMKSEAAWIRIGMRHLPKELSIPIDD